MKTYQQQLSSNQVNQLGLSWQLPNEAKSRVSVWLGTTRTENIKWDSDFTLTLMPSKCTKRNPENEILMQKGNFCFFKRYTKSYQWGEKLDHLIMQSWCVRI